MQIQWAIQRARERVRASVRHDENTVCARASPHDSIQMIKLHQPHNNRSHAHASRYIHRCKVRPIIRRFFRDHLETVNANVRIDVYASRDPVTRRYIPAKFPRIHSLHIIYPRNYERVDARRNIRRSSSE